jgi:transcription elongation factor B subunit 1
MHIASSVGCANRNHNRRRVVDYFHYKVRYSHMSEMPEFRIEPEIALELLMAANFLDT